MTGNWGWHLTLNVIQDYPLGITIKHIRLLFLRFASDIWNNRQENWNNNFLSRTYYKTIVKFIEYKYT